MDVAQLFPSKGTTAHAPPCLTAFKHPIWPPNSRLHFWS